MNRFSIRDIENLTGIRAHTIRIWEQRYGILQPKRTPTNIRYYDNEDLKTALRISLLNSYGYKISRIRCMTEVDMTALIGKINDNDFRLKVVTNNMLEAALDMNTIHFEYLLDSYISKYGIMQTVEQLLFCFLEKAGLMWMNDRLLPAQEHLVSNIIYRKLAAAIELLPREPSGTKPAILLFLPEGELHDLGLMYVQYLLRSAGHLVFYMGNNTPLPDAVCVYKAKNIQHVYLHLTCVTGSFELTAYMKQVSEAFSGAQIYLSGIMVQQKKAKLYPNIRILANLDEVKRLIGAI